MNIYLISQDVNNFSDAYSSAVVVAENAHKARKIHPGLITGYAYLDCWCHIDFVKVELIGKADKNFIKEKVICASFNNG